MTVRRPVLAILLLGSACGLARAGWFDLALNGDTVEASAGAHLGHDPEGRLAIGARALYSRRDEGDTKLLGFVMRFEANAESIPGLEFGVGIDALGGEGAGRDVGAATVAVRAAYAPPAWRGVLLGGGIGYAPGILSGRDTDNLLEWSAKVGYRVTRALEIVVEYRNVRASFHDDGHRDLVDDVLIGFGGRF